MTSWKFRRAASDCGALFFSAFRSRLPVLDTDEIVPLVPQPFEVIKQAALIVKDMHEHVSVIQDRPSALAHTLSAQGHREGARGGSKEKRRYEKALLA